MKQITLLLGVLLLLVSPALGCAEPVEAAIGLRDLGYYAIGLIAAASGVVLTVRGRGARQAAIDHGEGAK